MRTSGQGSFGPYEDVPPPQGAAPPRSGRGRPKGARDRIPRPRSPRVPIALRLNTDTREWLRSASTRLRIGPGELARRLLEHAARERAIPEMVALAIRHR